ncbi:MAG: 16S rRNA (uracil(1498)-N(3))-methyltransferase [Rubellimicrobium sp.]|nr:16S rRNA (uracil(1498)-N(3))-methyltransferase [Rubellimicrobium sp.]
MSPKLRLFLDHALHEGQAVPLGEAEANYLFAVMRAQKGTPVALFNGRDGEWEAVVDETGRRSGSLRVGTRLRVQAQPPDLWLLFAPLKKTRTDFVIEKAVEMGVARILPVLTGHTNSERVNVARLQAHAREAAEQCGALHVPEVAAPVPLMPLLDGWDDRPLWFCDEHLAGTRIHPPQAARGAVLIGPEGGFTDAERARLRTMPQAVPVALGPRILRAETAAVAALTLWQITCGDWR